MARINKLLLAGRAIRQLPPKVRTEGKFVPAQVLRPSHWQLTINECMVVLTEGALLGSVEPAISSMLDVWPDGGRKAFSVSWYPSQPWHPPRVAAFTAGSWIDRLGLGDE
jgi:hypothetical protein